MHLFEPVDKEPVLALEWECLCNTVKEGLEDKNVEICDCTLQLKDREIPLQGTRHTPVKKQPQAISE